MLRVEGRESVQARVLEAIAGIGSQLEPSAALRAIVAAAMDLTGARYGALGLIGDGGTLSGFIPVGMNPEVIAGIGQWPQGRGLLGELIGHPRPLRLHDLADHPSFAGFPPGHPPMRSFLGAPVLIRDELFGNLYLTDKRGGADFDAQDEELLAAVAGAAGLAVENARLRAEARRHGQWQQATAEVTQQLLAADEPRDVLALVTQHALEISGADVVTLGLPNAAGDHITITNASGFSAPRLIGLTAPLWPSLSGLVMASGRRLSVADFETDKRIPSSVRRLHVLGPGVVVPLGVPGAVHGVMIAARQAGSQPLPPAAVDMVTTFAVQAGIGLKLAEHRRDAQRIALLADRDRIARDLHDLVIQRLFATGMSLEGGMPLLPDGEAADRVRRAVDELDGTIRDIRSTIYTLQARDEPGQPETHARILAVVQEMTDALGFAPWLRIDGQLDARAPAQMTEDVLAVVREGLSNVARHARASQADLVVTADQDLVVVISDDGTGIASDRAWSGLANLTERAAELGGGLLVEAAEDGGTRLEWRVPLAGAQPP
ncbi:MAG TPA: GAF domain-containing protein [Streptosporangiaceae bacterium]|nr:GAF domain-containing protein [Streptosporangiaceae bacterium]